MQQLVQHPPTSVTIYFVYFAPLCTALSCRIVLCDSRTRITHRIRLRIHSNSTSMWHTLGHTLGHQMQRRWEEALTGRVNAVLVGDDLPEFGTDLVTALASLDVDEFALRARTEGQTTSAIAGPEGRARVPVRGELVKVRQRCTCVCGLCGEGSPFSVLGYWICFWIEFITGLSQK